MRYLYGDSRPFPLEGNFLDTMWAATQCCVALLRAQETAEAGKRTQQEARADAADHLAELDRLSLTLEAAFAPWATGARNPSPAHATAARLAQAAQAAIKQARAGVVKRRDTTLQAAAAVGAGEAAARALAGFFAEHELPSTSTRLRWRAGPGEAPAEAQLHLTTPCGIQAVLEVELPTQHLWARAVRVGALAPGLVLGLQREGGLLRKRVRVRDEALDRYLVVAVDHTPERRAVTLRRRGAGKAGFELVLPAGPEATATVRRLDDAGELVGQALELAGPGAEAAARLWARVEETTADLPALRRSLRLASLNGRSVREIDRPRMIADTLIEALAPLVREIRRHSRTPGELTIKRELGDGRREELWLLRADVVRLYEDLPPGLRTAFDAFGLGEDNTGEIVTHELHPGLAARPPLSPTLKLVSA